MILLFDWLDTPWTHGCDRGIPIGGPSEPLGLAVLELALNALDGKGGMPKASVTILASGWFWSFWAVGLG